MNLHGQGYPDVQRFDAYGPTEFFFRIQTFLSANRRRYPRVRRTVEEVATGRLCVDNGYPNPLPQEVFYRWADVTGPERCKELCEEEFRCADAFYYVENTCKIYLDAYTFESTLPTGRNDVHYRAGPFQPTISPVSDPPVAPTEPPIAPTNTPVAPTTPPSAPAPSFCISNTKLKPYGLAGYTCAGSEGDTTTVQCNRSARARVAPGHPTPVPRRTAPTGYPKTCPYCPVHTAITIADLCRFFHVL